MRISDWSSDMCSSDLAFRGLKLGRVQIHKRLPEPDGLKACDSGRAANYRDPVHVTTTRISPRRLQAPTQPNYPICKSIQNQHSRGTRTKYRSKTRSPRRNDTTMGPLQNTGGIGLSNN